MFERLGTPAVGITGDVTRNGISVRSPLARLCALCGEASGSYDGTTAAESYAGIWVTRPDHAARFSVLFVATPSVNVTPSTTFGNWFAPFRRRHVFAAA